MKNFMILLKKQKSKNTCLFFKNELYFVKLIFKTIWLQKEHTNQKLDAEIKCMVFVRECRHQPAETLLNGGWQKAEKD